MFTLKHSNSEKGNVMMTSSSDMKVTHLSTQPTASGWAVAKKLLCIYKRSAKQYNWGLFRNFKVRILLCSSYFFLK